MKFKLLSALDRIQRVISCLLVFRFLKTLKKQTWSWFIWIDCFYLYLNLQEVFDVFI